MDVMESITQFVPLAYTSQEKIQSLQDWAAAGKVRLASTVEEIK
jgi:hypothetical protein